MLTRFHPCERGMRLAAALCWLTGSCSLSAQTQTPSPPTPETPECVRCHGGLRAALQKKVVHAAVEMGCTACHVEHRRSGSRTTSARYLNQPQPDLCLTCHDATDAKLVAAHRAQPFQKAVCTRCHDPHSSDQPKLVPSQGHGPYAARQCESCHQAPQGDKVRLAASSNELCFACHQDFRQKLAGLKFRHTLLASEANSCLDCHDPHASSLRYSLKGPDKDLCTTCHPGTLEGGRFQHEPVRVSCTFCHDAHGSNAPKNLHAPLNALCLECHGQNAPLIVQSEAPTLLFGGRVTIAPRTFGELRWLQIQLDKRKGHPFPNHPVFVPAEGAKAEVTCLTCHRPHAGDGSPRRFVTGRADTNSLCVRCH